MTSTTELMDEMMTLYHEEKMNEAELFYSSSGLKYMFDEFHRLCLEGNLKEAQLFYLSHDVMPLLDECLYYGIGHYYAHSHFELLFEDVCRRGHIQVAKWLYQLNASLGYTKIKPNVIYSSFDNTCCSGHLDVAQWLYQIEPLVIYSNKIQDHDIDNYKKHYKPQVVDWINTLLNENVCNCI